MKINYVLMIIGMLIFTLGSVESAIAQEITTGPPPQPLLTVELDNDIYFINDTLKIFGNVETQKPDQPVMIQIYYPNNQVYISEEVSVLSNGTYTFEQKIEGKVVSGEYKVDVFYGDFSTTARFMIIAGPYNMIVDGKNYPIEYKINTGILSDINVNSTEKSLTVHVINSSQSGELTLRLPRSVIDANADNSGYGSFMVLMNNKPTDLQQTSFSEIAQDSDSRTLLIRFPYNGTNTLYDEWYIKILGTHVVPEFSVLSIGLAASFAAVILPWMLFSMRKRTYI